MGGKKKTFGSFAEAAAALKNMAVGKPKKTGPSQVADFRPRAITRADVADMEAAMLATDRRRAPSLEALSKASSGKNRNPIRGKVTLIHGPPVTQTMVAEEIAAYRRKQEAKAAQTLEELERNEEQAEKQRIYNQNRAAAKAAFLAAQAKARNARCPDQGTDPAGTDLSKPRTAPATPSGPTRNDVLKTIRKVFASSPPPIEHRPRSVHAITRQPVEHAIAVGAKLFAARPDPDHSGYIIGCDFGTSSTKIVIRQPYSAGDPVARPVPSALRSTNHPYLWQSVVWYEPKTGAFSLLPGKGTIALEGFKAGILAGEGGRLVVKGVPVTRNEAATAFLTLQLSHCLGWYEEARPLGDQGGDHFLAINVGIPVAAQDDGRTYKDFRHLVAAARDLIGDAAHLTLEKVRAVDSQSAPELPDGFDLVPELAAAIFGYANNKTHSRDGSHVMIDVGASTLDIVAFNLVNRVRVAAFAAEVQLLGAAALEASRNEGFEDTLFRNTCLSQFDSVYHYARRSDVAPREFDQTLRRKPVQLIAVGGGCNTEVHTDMIARVNPCLGDLKILSPQPPLQLAAGPCDASRLLLAYGLTADIPEQLELRRPSDIPRIVPAPSTAICFVSKDQA